MMELYDINCPYCGAKLNIDHDDGYGYEENETFQQECEGCGLLFVYTTHVIYDYAVYKADCLNGGVPHDFKPTVTNPKCCTRMVCSVCDESREPTDDERKEYGIPTRAEYLKELNGE